MSKADFAPIAIPALREAALAFDLDAKVVIAVATVESGLNPWAVRYERGYSYLWDVLTERPLRLREMTPPSDFPCLPASPDRTGRTEWVGQKTSWGLMQVMGAVARERGFRGAFLSELCDPAVGAHYGCKHLKHLYNRHSDRYGWKGVLTAYNAGSPTADPTFSYALKIQERIRW